MTSRKLAQKTPKTAEGVRKLCEEARQGIRIVTQALIALKYGGAELLGYKTFAAAVEGEFSQSKRWADEQIDLAEIRQRLAPPTGQTMGAAAPIVYPELTRAGLRKLKCLTTEKEQKAACDEALDMSGDKPEKFNRYVQVAVDRVLEEREAAPGEEEEPEPLLDQLGREVPETLRGAFEGRASVLELAALANKAKLRLKDVRVLCSKCGRKPKPDKSCLECDGKGAIPKPGSERLNLAALRKRLSGAVHSLKLAAPHAVCTVCAGAGCRQCENLGWVTGAQLEGGELTQNQQRLLQKRGHETEGMSKAEASRIIDDIAAAEGWKPKDEDLGEF